MHNFSASDLLQRKRTFFAIAALTVLLFCTANLPWQLDDYDQAKQAFTSFEMIKEGRWLYQHTPNGRVATKPPLVGWTSAALFILTRSWGVAWRSPSLLAAIALSIFLTRAATSAYGHVAGLAAFSAFSWNLFTPRLATLVRTDMPLALAVFLIGVVTWEKIRKGEPWKRSERFSIFALLTAALLIKGPIVYAFLLPGMAAFAYCRGSGRAATVWCGWLPWTASLGVFLIWVVGGILSEPRFFDEVVKREFLARFGEAIHHPQPLLFYLPHLLQKFFPWSVLALALSVVALGSQKWNLRSAFRQIPPATLWLVCWSLGGILVMSLVPSKRVDRIFPVVPPLCLLFGAQVARIGSEDERRQSVYRWSAAALLVSILFAGGYSVAKVVVGYREHRDALAAFGREVRNQATAYHWRYEVIRGSDEAILLYLEQTRFAEPGQAIARWNVGQLDALVVPGDQLPNFLPRLREVGSPSLQSAQRKNLDRPNYMLLTHD
jgi:4-amino-4-deoxy-L-arabinose transferase-like glycosyltransferase